MKYIKKITKLLFCCIVLCCGCKKLIETDLPVDQISTGAVFQNGESAISALSNVYYTFNTYLASNYNSNIGLYTDELIYNSSQSSIQEFMNANISAENSTNLNIWRYFYSVVYQSNMILEQLQGATVSTKLKAQIEGESLFLRSFAFFYLTQLYGEVPLILTTDVKVTTVKGRDHQVDIMNRIESDLQQAKNLLGDDYPSTERVRVNKGAAQALLSRVYLFNKRYKQAVDESSLQINDQKYKLEHPENTFRKASLETIFQFWILEGYTKIGRNYLPLSGVPPYLLPSKFLSLFEDGDLRKDKWTQKGSDGVLVSKYRQNNTISGVLQEYFIALRLAEQYLIRAEAYTNLGDLTSAKKDINTIRERAGLTDYGGRLSGDALLTEIEKQRHLEYFNEWGDRLLDLRRYGHLDSIMEITKPGWAHYRTYFPIPVNEIKNNPNLSQNQGY